MTKQPYGMKVTTLLNAEEKLSKDLEYLCSLIEQPDSEFAILDALVYSHAVMAISNQLEYIAEDLSGNELNEDEDYVKLSQDEVFTLSSYNDISESAIKALEEICGISLQSN